MMPYIRRKTDDVLVRLDVFYEELLRVKFGIGVDENGIELRPGERQQELYREIFGNNVVDLATPEWYYAQIWLDAGILPHKWDTIPIESRARWMAAKRIDGIVKAIDRYRDVIERKNKEALNKLRSPNKASSRKRR